MSKPEPPEGYVMWDGKAGDIVPEGALLSLGSGWWIGSAMVGRPCAAICVGHYAVPAPKPEEDIRDHREIALRVLRVAGLSEDEAQARADRVVEARAHGLRIEWVSHQCHHLASGRSPDPEMFYEHPCSVCGLYFVND